MNERNCYVLLTIAAPFGDIQQVSGLMLPSEAAMTAGSFMPLPRPPRDRFAVWIKDVRVVQLKDVV